MFDIGFWELCLIGVLALIILGPERLPQVARTAGLWMGRARRFLGDVKADIDREIREGELSAVRDIRDDLQDAKNELTKAGDTLNKSIDNVDAVGTGEKDELVEAINKPVRPAENSGQDGAIESVAGEQSGEHSSAK
ncbi:MAG: Sec-independent protein translocase protein TatB [Gammaproteobacteria bacterium]|nr:Sec-independent protein translocase protein TatB [Gammaproteobacteria bacterium]